MRHPNLAQQDMMTMLAVVRGQRRRLRTTLALLIRQSGGGSSEPVEGEQSDDRLYMLSANIASDFWAPDVPPHCGGAAADSIGFVWRSPRG